MNEFDAALDNLAKTGDVTYLQECREWLAKKQNSLGCNHDDLEELDKLVKMIRFLDGTIKVFTNFSNMGRAECGNPR